MLQKQILVKLPAHKLKPLTQQALIHCPQFDGDHIGAFLTPRYNLNKLQDLQIYKTQKLEPALKASTHRERLPSLNRIQTHFKQNLFDLDLFFQNNSSQNCQNDQLHQKHLFVIHKVKTPSITSKGKETATGSPQTSIQIAQKEESDFKNATESTLTIKQRCRGKSQSKHFMPCRIVNSKKLPFDIKPKVAYKQKEPFKDLQLLDVSIIIKKETTDPLISVESYQNLCCYL